MYYLKIACLSIIIDPVFSVYFDIVCSSSRDTVEIIEKKFAIVDIEQNLLQNKRQESQNKNSDLTRKPTPTKFILPLDIEQSFAKEEVRHGNVIDENYINNFSGSSNGEEVCSDSKQNKKAGDVGKSKVEELKRVKKEHLGVIANIKRQIAEIEIQGEELHREVSIKLHLTVGSADFYYIVL